MQTLVDKLYDADKADSPAIIILPDSAERDVIRQLAKQPLWDGDVNSKTGRDLLVSKGYVARWNGLNFLTQTGFAVVDALWGMEKFVRQERLGFPGRDQRSGEA